MSTAVLAPPGSPFESACAPRARTIATVSGGGGATLEDVLSAAWEGLAAHRTVSCPVCGGTMAPRYGASGAAPVGGRCTSCHTTLG